MEIRIPCAVCGAETIYTAEPVQTIDFNWTGTNNKINNSVLSKGSYIVEIAGMIEFQKDHLTDAAFEKESKSDWYPSIPCNFSKLGRPINDSYNPEHKYYWFYDGSIPLEFSDNLCKCLNTGKFTITVYSIVTP